MLHQSFFSTENSTAYSFFYLDTNPYSIDGVDWLLSARSLAPEIEEKFQIKIYFVDGASVGYDAVHAVYEDFPIIISVTLCLVFALMAIAFKSISAPLRLVLTIVLTLAFVYGLAVLVYQFGLFEFLHVDALANYHSMNWLPPGNVIECVVYIYVIFLPTLCCVLYSHVLYYYHWSGLGL